VKGKDVKFSVDDFESVKTTPWEGVRNHQAKNFMKDMECGDRVLFYHSNCKTPGIAAFAEVSKEAYPDYTAWDIQHPYYDEKTDQENPKWFMVNVTFSSRAKHFIPLALFRHIAALSPSELSDEIVYVGESGVKAIKEMVLVNSGRLSVQPMSEEAWGVIETMAEKGGWEEMELAKGKVKTTKGDGGPKKTNKGRGTGKGKTKDREDGEDEDLGDIGAGSSATNTSTAGRKRKAVDKGEAENDRRRSTRVRK